MRVFVAWWSDHEGLWLGGQIMRGGAACLSDHEEVVA